MLRFIRYFFSLLTLIGFSNLLEASPIILATSSSAYLLTHSLTQNTNLSIELFNESIGTHDVHLKPSYLKKFHEADIVIYMNQDMESYPIHKLSLIFEAQFIALLDNPNLKQNHSHAHDHKHSHDHEHSDEHAHAGGHGHSHGSAHSTPNILLSAYNLKQTLQFLATTLTEAFPENQATFQSNLTQAITAIDQANQITQAQLAFIPREKFSVVTSSDAFDYFLSDHEIKAIFSLDHGNIPKSKTLHKRIKTLQAEQASGKIICLFGEPEADNQIIHLLIKAAAMSEPVSSLDSSGSHLTLDKDFYPNLLKQTAADIAACYTKAIQS